MWVQYIKNLPAVRRANIGGGKTFHLGPFSLSEIRLAIWPVPPVYIAVMNAANMYLYV